MNNPLNAFLVEITGASSISARMAAVGTDPFSQGTLYEGQCRRLEISSGTLKAYAEYYTIYNATSSTLAVGDHVAAVLMRDEDSDSEVLVAITSKLN